MRVLVSTAFWGEGYVETFANYSLASLLSPGNLPEAAKSHEITLQLIAPEADLARFRALADRPRIETFCFVDEVSFEQLGLDPRRTPRDLDVKKYDFLSRLQNHALAASLKYDAIVVNYADFVWADSALANAIGSLDGARPVDAVLTFCPPVDHAAGRAALDALRAGGSGSGALRLAPRDAARIALDHLHREARLRILEDGPFTTSPSYVMWRVGDEGLVVRAFHQTVLAMRVRPDDPDFTAGIREGSLDGNFSSLIAGKGSHRIADDSDSVFVFSLYDTDLDSIVADGSPTPEILNWFLIFTTPSQRRMALHPILLKAGYDDTAAWKRTIAASRDYLLGYKAFAEVYFSSPHVPWRVKARAYAFDKILPVYSWLAHSTVGDIYRSIASPALRARVRSLFMRGKMSADASILALQKASDSPAASETDAEEELSEAEQEDARLFAMFYGDDSTDDIVARFVDDGAPHVVLAKGPEAGADLPPRYDISPGAWAGYSAVLFAEGRLGNVGDPALIARVLDRRTELLQRAMAEEPLWAEVADWYANNLFLSGRHEEAMSAFDRAARVRAEMGAAWGYPENAAVYLPRSCAFSIGLMTHVEGYVKHKMLTGDPRPYRLLVPKETVVNPTYLEYFRPYIEIYSDDADIERLSIEEPAYAFNWNWAIPDAVGTGVEHIHRRLAAVQRQWRDEGRQPLFKLSEVHEDALERQIAAWGLEEDDWFVCLHVRSAGYHGEAEKGANDFRNTPLSDYYPAIEAIVEAGGWVIRMGDASMPPIDMSALRRCDRVVDYALSDAKSDVLDVGLCARCRLFVAAPSGLAGVAASFGRPSALVNYPLQIGLPWHPIDHVIYQRVYSRAENRYLTFTESLASPVPYAITSYLLERAGVEMHKNDPEEIVELVMEALGAPRTAKDPDEVAAARRRFADLRETHRFGASGRLGAHYCCKYAADFA